MIPEALLRETEHGLMPGGDGWFVLNARNARWWYRGHGFEAGMGGKGNFPQLGVGLTVLERGEPMTRYHWETDQEDFLILAGEGLVIIENEERPLKQWDFVHCPPGTNHAIVGAGDDPCVVFSVGARERHTYVDADGQRQGREDGGAYTVSQAAIRHGAGVEKETTEADEAYAGLPGPDPMRYRDGWLYV